MEIVAVLLLLMTAILIAIFAFEILMFLDVLRNPKLKDTEKVLWIGGMFLLHPFIAIIYYFVAHTRLNTRS